MQSTFRKRTGWNVFSDPGFNPLSRPPYSSAFSVFFAITVVGCSSHRFDMFSATRPSCGKDGRICTATSNQPRNTPSLTNGWLESTSFFLGWPMFRCYVSFMECISLVWVLPHQVRPCPPWDQWCAGSKVRATWVWSCTCGWLDDISSLKKWADCGGDRGAGKKFPDFSAKVPWNGFCDRSQEGTVLKLWHVLPMLDTETNNKSETNQGLGLVISFAQPKLLGAHRRLLISYCSVFDTWKGRCRYTNKYLFQLTMKSMNVQCGSCFFHTVVTQIHLCLCSLLCM